MATFSIHSQVVSGILFEYQVEEIDSCRKQRVFCKPEAWSGCSGVAGTSSLSRQRSLWMVKVMKIPREWVMFMCLGPDLESFAQLITHLCHLQGIQPGSSH